LLELTILGCGSALPTTFRNPTAQFIRQENHNFLIDCGEGTQLAFRKYKLPLQKLSAIFISHLHGDHCYGLPGLVSSFSLLKREKPLTIVGPKGIGDFLYHIFSHSKTYLDFELNFVEIDSEIDSEIDGLKKVYENRNLTVSAFKLNHRVPCYGYLFKEKVKPRRINKESLDEYDIPIAYRNRIKAGEDFETTDGSVIPNHKLTFAPKPAATYAFCSDNRIQPGQLKFLAGTHTIYHEATFLDVDKLKAEKTMHSTAKEAGELASKLSPKQLLIGHYSARHLDPKPLENEARSIFKNTIAVEDGQTFQIE
jgi:ribonuclease Z